MSEEPRPIPNRGYAIATLSTHIHTDEPDQLMVSAFLYQERGPGQVLVEMVDPEFGGPAAGQWYLPGVPLRFNEHPEEAAHRILTEELEVEDRSVRLLRVQSHKAEHNRWYLMFLYGCDPLTPDELENPCEGIQELAYRELTSLPEQECSQALRDILAADKVGNSTYE